MRKRIYWRYEIVVPGYTTQTVWAYKHKISRFKKWLRLYDHKIGRGYKLVATFRNWVWWVRYER